MATMTEQRAAPPREPRRVASRLEAASWGVFFVWVGYVLVAGFSIGVGLIGVGAIALITQVARKLFELPLEGFWVLVGLGFVLGGLWNLYDIQIPFASVVLFAIGALLLAGAVLGKRGGDG